MEQFLPADLKIKDVVAVIGLISDTHAPQRWPDVPPVVNDIFNGVDLILHAGDVGQLWVLDRLSRIAAVVAVHGNDDTPDAQRQLPYQQILALGGTRLLLWHSHFPNREEELAFRRFDDWTPKLQREIDRAQGAGASIVVHGHTHIPMVCQQDDVLIVNPGAIASGNHFLRQTRQSVALLFLTREGLPMVSHVDLSAPAKPFIPPVEWQAGFTATMQHYSESILAPGLEPLVKRLRSAPIEDPASLLRAIEPACHRCWAGSQPYLTSADLVMAIDKAPDISKADKMLLRALLVE